MFTQLVNSASLAIGQLTASYLIPTMLIIFVCCLGAKMLIYYLSRTQYKVVKEFEIRVHRHLDETYDDTKGLNFHKLTRVLLNKTWNDYFLMRKKNLRRRFDRTTSFLDRIFYIDSASRNLFEDTIKQTTYIEKELNPNFRSVTNFAFSSNVYFNHLFGILPIRLVNQFLALLPGLFIIGGIFGTFLGIVKGIPELKGLDPTNVDSARIVLNHFLDQMAFSMNTSIMGIFFSVFFTIVNSLFSPKSLQADAFEVYTHSLEFLYKNAKNTAASSEGSGSEGDGSDEEDYNDEQSEEDLSQVKTVLVELPTEEQRQADRIANIKKDRGEDQEDETIPKVIVLNEVPDIPMPSEQEFDEELEVEYGDDEVEFEFNNEDKTGS